jgi:hypothetical protein
MNFSLVYHKYHGCFTDTVNVSVTNHCLQYFQVFNNKIKFLLTCVPTQHYYWVSGVLMHGHAGQLTGGPTRIGTPC